MGDSPLKVTYLGANTQDFWCHVSSSQPNIGPVPHNLCHPDAMQSDPGLVDKKGSQLKYVIFQMSVQDSVLT